MNSDNRMGKQSKRFYLKKSKVLQAPDVQPEIVSISYKLDSIEIQWDIPNKEEISIEGFIIKYKPVGTHEVNYTIVSINKLYN